MREIMTIPVFDASHPAVQNALRAANAAGGTSSALNNRDLRHAMEKDSLEAHMRSGGTARCPTCRHPERGSGIRRENLRIDTALQDEILQFLRTALGIGASSSAARP